MSNKTANTRIMSMALGPIYRVRTRDHQPQRSRKLLHHCRIRSNPTVYVGTPRSVGTAGEVTYHSTHHTEPGVLPKLSELGKVVWFRPCAVDFGTEVIGAERECSRA